MKLLLAMILASGLAYGESKAPALIKNLAGCFSVSYRFVENGKYDYEIPNKSMPVVYEWITVKDDTKGAHIAQHYGVYKNDAGKFETMVHFYEEWTSPKANYWVQRVISPSGVPRYTCESAERFGQLACQSKGAPKPVRDTNRKDYDVLNRGTTLQITPLGWVQNEINDKVKKDGTVVATEVGWIEYRRLEDDSVCADAKKEFP